MSIEALTWAFNDAPGVPSHTLSVLLGLANHAASDGTHAFPTQAALARKARKTIRQVQNDLETLQASGLIRSGDPRYVEHIEADRRPLVWDLAMERHRGKNDEFPKDWKPPRKHRRRDTKPTSGRDTKPTSGRDTKPTSGRDTKPTSGRDTKPTSGITVNRTVNRSSTRAPDDAVAVIRRFCPDADDAEIRELMNPHAGPATRNLAAVLTDRGSKGLLVADLAALRSGANETQIAQIVDELRQGPSCEHGVPGGSSLHPGSRQPLCPQCRAALGHIGKARL